MRITILISILAAFCMVSSCGDNMVVPDQPEPCVATRALTVEDEDVSQTNPNLLTDWENVDKILLSSNKDVSAPWVSGSTTRLPYDFRTDIKKEDGWDMLFHTFKKLGFEEKKNYMCFYNRFTGVLKIFFYNDTEKTGGSNTQWTINQTSRLDQPLHILDTPNFFSKANDEDSDNESGSLSITNNIPGITQGLTRGWNGFEYQIPRYSSQSVDCDISIGANDITVINFEFLGSSDQITTGTIKTAASSGKSTKEGIAVQSGSEAIKYLNKFATTRTGLKDVSLIGEKVGNALRSDVSSNPYNCISQGAKYIFGRSTATSSSGNSEVYLETNGKITLSGTGTITTPSIVDPISFNLKDILKKRNTASGQNVSSSIVTANTDYEALGVWNIKTLPRVSYHPAGLIFPSRITKVYPVDVKGEFAIPYFYNDIPEIIFNPAIKPYIKSYKTDVSVFNCLKANKKEYLPQVDDVYGYTMLIPEYKDSEKEIYSFKDFFEMEYRTVYSPEMLNDKDTNVFYFNWGSILEGRLIAYVSVEMDINYKGKEFKVYETRAYPVVYCPFISASISEYHNPPYSFVINIGYPLRDDPVNPDTGNPFMAPKSIPNMNPLLRK